MGILLQQVWYLFQRTKRVLPKSFSIAYINSFCLLAKATNTNMANPQLSLTAQHVSIILVSLNCFCFFLCLFKGWVFFSFLFVCLWLGFVCVWFFGLKFSLACLSYSIPLTALFFWSAVSNLSSRTSHSSHAASYSLQQPVSIKILAAKITFLPSITSAYAHSILTGSHFFLTLYSLTRVQ